jgi:hypothetical protein
VHSILVRLGNEARARRRPFAELLDLYAAERFLHRLGHSRWRDQFVLKGALLLRGWLGVHCRPTRDIDLLGPADLDEETLRGVLADLLGTPVEDDGVEYSVDSISIARVRVDSPSIGFRAKFDGRLWRTRLRHQVDIGLGDAVFPPVVEVAPGKLLGLPMAAVRAYTPYTSIAEKLQAMVERGVDNSRLKDYYDLDVLSRQMEFDGDTLLEAIRHTFQHRAAELDSGTPAGLSDIFAQSPLARSRWQAFVGRSALSSARPDLGETVSAVRRFALPILKAFRDGVRFVGHWPSGGPWEGAP